MIIMCPRKVGQTWAPWGTGHTVLQIPWTAVANLVVQVSVPWAAVLAAIPALCPVSSHHYPRDAARPMNKSCSISSKHRRSPNAPFKTRTALGFGARCSVDSSSIQAIGRKMATLRWQKQGSISHPYARNNNNNNKISSVLQVTAQMPTCDPFYVIITASLRSQDTPAYLGLGKFQLGQHRRLCFQHSFLMI